MTLSQNQYIRISHGRHRLPVNTRGRRSRPASIKKRHHAAQPPPTNRKKRHHGAHALFWQGPHPTVGIMSLVALTAAASPRT